MKFIYTLGVSVFLYMATPISAQNLLPESNNSDNHVNNTHHKINYQDKALPNSSDPVVTETYTEKDRNESYPPENGPLPHFADSQGELNVSALGSSNYTVPIALPPGIKNVAPQISLTYNSSSDNGLAGYGWNIAGISTISLVSTRIDVDGYVDGVNFNEDDRYSLDGQRLIPREGGYGKENTVYQTEIYSNLYIVSAGSISMPGIEGKRPEYFQVIFPDGTMALYGSSEDSRGVTEWLIKKWVDLQGNFIEYFYDRDQNTTYIYKIVWGKNEKKNTEYSNTIQFYYKKRERAEFAYVHGIKMVNNRVLDKVEVYAGDQLFKKYQINHQTITGNYQRVVSVQEFNGDGDPANPIVFSYTTTDNSFEEFTKDKSEALWDLKQVKMTGDFSGNGQVDVVAGGKLYKDLFQNLGKGEGNIVQINSEKLIKYPISTLTGGKMNNFQSIVTYKSKDLSYLPPSDYRNHTDNELSLMVSNFNKEQNKFEENYIRTIKYPHGGFHADECAVDSDKKFTYNNKVYYDFIEGDFNGDGISEIIVLGSADQSIKKLRDVDYGVKNDFQSSRSPNLHCITSTSKEYFSPYYVDMNPLLSDQESYHPLNQNSFLNDAVNFVIDFDGDGKSDIISFNKKDKFAKEGDFKISTLTKNKEFNVIVSGNIPQYDGEKPVLFGDFNGDGKTDFMIPEKIGSSDWYMYISTGKGFQQVYYPNLAEYLPEWKGKGQTKRRRYKTYTVSDLNKDGKTDLIISVYESYGNGWEGSRNGKAHLEYFENLGGEEKPQFSYREAGHIWSKYGYNDPITLLFADYKNNQKTGNIIFVQGNEIWKGGFNKDLRKDILLKGISESEGNIVTQIEYASLEPNEKNGGLGDIEGVYHSSLKEKYPYKEISQAPNLDIVKKLTVTAGGKKREKEYKYFGLVSHAQGLGLLGFKKVAESSWKSQEISAVNWNVTAYSPKLRGLPISNWKTRGGNLDLIMNPDKEDLLISKKDFRYLILRLSDKRWIKILQNEEEKDYLTGISTVTKYEYDEFYNIRKITVNNGEGKKITEHTYDNFPYAYDTRYYVGRLVQTRTRTSAYGEVHTTEENYSYTGNLVTKVMKKGHLTDYITEDIKYDEFGNLIEKTVSAPGVSPRTVTDEYDPSGRFVIKKTDADHLTEHFTYNNLGQVLSHTSPMNVLTETRYDSWGKVQEVKTTGISLQPLLTRTLYERTEGGGIKITTFNEDTREYSQICKDVLGHEVKTTIRGFEPGTYISKQTVYDALGRKSKESEPYFEGENPQGWNTTQYDDFSRPVQQNLFTGKTITTVYKGLSVTTDDGVKKQTLTRDANGNIRTLNDNGEIIEYTYDANGNQKTARYGDHTLISLYDGWGRRISFLDPSVSTIPYTHTYNNYGEVLKETTPDGTTVYTYSPTGKLLTKQVKGKDTDLSVNYEYSNTGLLIKEHGNYNRESYTYHYFYNTNNQLEKSEEITPHATYRNEYTYDLYGTTINEEKTTLYGNFKSSVMLAYSYNDHNGMMEKIDILKEGEKQPVWQLTQANERLQSLIVKLGNEIIIKNSIDKAGYLTQTRHLTRRTHLLTVEYDFDWKSGNLNSRYRDTYNWKEEFTYDPFERLVSWTDPEGTHSLSYETDGRITDNSEVGKYQYTTTARYQKTSIDLNTDGKNHYQTSPLQQITYNALKKPVAIRETEKLPSGKNGTSPEVQHNIKFTYNLHTTRSSATIQNNTQETQKKYYSDSQDVEIILENGLIKIITYIGGSPYSAPAAHVIQIKERNPQKPEETLYYFHRDYQGTLLAITDEIGKAIEQRLFDPWGKILKVTDRKGKTTSQNPQLIFTDRGYTGHEHFTTVGLIHMNGRMYDPILKQFLSPDNHIQDPYNAQNYNRYSYVLNNPLKYTDPSGELFTVAGTAWLGAAVIGATIGAVSYTTYALCTDSFLWGGFVKSILMGGAGGAAAYGVGSLAGVIRTGISTTTQTLTNLQVDILAAGIEGAMNGLTQGIIQGISGGDILQGISSGSISSLVSTAVSMGGTAAGVDGTKIGGTLFFGTVSGGFGAVLTNGNFWQGAATGLIVSGLNHVAHQMDGVHIAQESPNTGGDPNPNRNWRQDKLLSKGEINRLEKAIGWNHGDKGQNNRGGGKKDLYKDKDGNIYEKPKGGKGPGEWTGINIKDLYTGSLLNKIGEGILKIIDKASTRLTPFFMPTIVPIFMNNTNEYINQVN
ncbi:RHS repeat-associated core domain-containing protein [Apibacter mensalis]|uniref:RHS repeat-associated core domain-containing protein n=1 Tax=Apibacter mensalis TaxID=1586267 RepID=A0A0X3AP93_9FLAO|nr:polymorphic toxin type 33 domain-containing protein [Apibacter mensalis]CVK16210.1 RHS repeat-associated core domain-containing protein [Apibacter mensalis]